MKYDKNLMAISDRIEADCHKHWLIQMFLSSHKDLNIEVNGQLIHCSAILVNLDTPHTFNTEGDAHFTMLIDPTTEIGRSLRGMLKNQPFYVFPHEEAIAMQCNFKNVLEQKKCNKAYLLFVQNILFQFAYGNKENFDERVMKVLNLLDVCSHEDEFHQIKFFSKKVSLSESRLAHLFKAETGIPLKSYIVLHKLQKAYESFYNGENITTAALNAGFDSSSHLAYTNKMMTGMSVTNIIRDSEFLKVL